MSKAILVMDMPNSCRDCVLCIASREKHTGQFCWRCVNHPTIMIEKNGTKPEWCPLRELPQKKEATQQPLSPLLQTQYTDYEAGYNACIDEIMRGSEENG